VNILLTAIMCCVAVPAAVAAATRLPQWSERRNLRVISAGALLAVSFAMMIPTVYGTLDVGNHNYLDLVVKGALFLALNILCGEVALANGNSRLARGMSSWPGGALLAGFMLALLLMFLQIRTTASSPALEEFLGQGWTVAYNTAANAYPAVIGLILLPTLARSLRQPGSSSQRRLATSITVTGFALSAIGTMLLPALAHETATYRLDQAVNGLAALIVVAGHILAYREMGSRKYDRIAPSALRAD